MKSVRVKSLAVGAMLLLALAGAVPAASFAGESISFRQQFPTVSIASGGRVWRQAASISLNAPSAGAIVVTASGMAFFNSLSPPTLTLALSRNPATKGPWIFTTAPGRQPFQTYTVRMVFDVAAGPNTFFLNARSNDGDGRSIGIQTGSMTAEFYPDTAIELQPAPAARSADMAPGEAPDPRRN